MTDKPTDGRKKNGGSNRGQGRKPLPLNEEKAKNYTTTLQPLIKQKAVDLFGSISNAIKWAVEQKE